MKTSKFFRLKAHILNKLFIWGIITSFLSACGNGNDVIPEPIPKPETLRRFYVSNSIGSDSNDGTSENTPWKTLNKIKEMTFLPGDSILLKSGDTWSETVEFSSKFKGNEAKPIVLSSYGEGNKPQITSPTGSILMTIKDADFFNVSNLDLGPGIGYGMVFSVSEESGELGNINIKNVSAHDLGLVGIFFNTKKNKNITIDSCTGDKVEMLFAISGGNNINISNSTARNCLYGGFYITSVTGGLMDQCAIFDCGRGNYPNGACGIILGGNDGFEIRNTEVAGQLRQGTNPDGEAIDFEHSNKNVKISNCYFHDNAGPAIMFFDNNRGLVNSGCVIDNCIFDNNGLNSSNPGGFDIFFTNLNDNNDGAITNNIFTLRSGHGFVTTTDPSVVISGNKTADGIPLNIAPPFENIPLFLNSSFEEPIIPSSGTSVPGAIYRPIGASWTFRKNAGIARNGSAFGAPNAPEGSQVLFLQGVSNISQFVSLPIGTYKIQFKCAARNPSGDMQNIDFMVNNTKVGNVINPIGNTQFDSFETAPFTINESGYQMVQISGTYNGDRTAFIDEVTIVKIEKLF